MTLRRRVPIVVVLLLTVLTGGLALADARQASPVAQATPAAALPGVTSEVLGRTAAADAPGRELALARVTVAPGATIPPHEHPGPQVASIEAGELTYTVLIDEVGLTRASGETEAIGAGQTVVLRAGDVVVEEPGALHTARNAGTETVVILLSTLFAAGEPRTIFVATPVAGIDGGTPAAGMAAPVRTEGDVAGSGFVGAWRVEPTIAGQINPALTTFTADGSVFTSNRPVQPGPPALTDGPIAQSLGHGSWEATGDRTASITFELIQTDLAGTYLGTRTIRGSLALDASGNVWTGAFAFAVADASGAVVQSGEGSVRATRIGVEPAGTPAP